MSRDVVGPVQGAGGWSVVPFPVLLPVPFPVSFPVSFPGGGCGGSDVGGSLVGGSDDVPGSEVGGSLVGGSDEVGSEFPLRVHCVLRSRAARKPTRTDLPTGVRRGCCLA
ncbi:hypothetical protein GCM10010256_82880 [Streptomyces coeruleorubidus]|nr:hypothetical protein GCM10010256_82880 [Streptomyces coeruleorubidus]